MTKATEKAGMQSSAAVPRTSVSCESGRARPGNDERGRQRPFATSRRPGPAAGPRASAGCPARGAGRAPAPPRRTPSALAACSSGMTKASTNPGSDPSARNALGGQSDPQLLHGVGTGYCSTSSALGRNSTPTVTAAARNSSLSARAAQPAGRVGEDHVDEQRPPPARPRPCPRCRARCPRTPPAASATRGSRSAPATGRTGRPTRAASRARRDPPRSARRSPARARSRRASGARARHPRELRRRPRPTAPARPRPARPMRGRKVVLGATGGRAWRAVRPMRVDRSIGGALRPGTVPRPGRYLCAEPASRDARPGASVRRPARATSFGAGPVRR